jgi:hypothetical protein
MKVKSFKLVTGVQNDGADGAENKGLNNAAHERTEDMSLSSDKPANVANDASTIRNIISVDGERYPPGHGIICECHQGIATVIADNVLRKYQPSILTPPRTVHDATAEATAAAAAEPCLANADDRIVSWTQNMDDLVKQHQLQSTLNRDTSDWTGMDENTGADGLSDGHNAHSSDSEPSRHRNHRGSTDETDTQEQGTS